MSPVLIVLAVVTGILVLLSVLSYFQSKKASVKLSSEEFKASMRKGQLVDVRTKQEYEAGHINGARNINVTMITREFQKLRKDQPIYIYCSTGRRSARAALFLKTKGYTNLYELKNGLKNWDGQLK